MVLKNIIGFIIYIIIFVLFIPLFFYNKKKFLFLEVYLPNLDLIANLLISFFYTNDKISKKDRYIFIFKPSLHN